MQNEEEKYVEILTYLLMMKKNDYLKQWCEFQNDIRYNDRFYLKNTLFLDNKQLLKLGEITLEKDKKLFRARKIINIKEIQFFNEIIELLKKEYSTDGLEIDNITFDWFMDKIVLDEVLHYQKDKNYDTNELEKIISNIGEFKGFDKAGSGAPPKGNATAGRANSKGISSLYLSESVNTAILEVQPINTQYVSVATIEIKKDLKLFDFTIEFKWNERNLDVATLFQMLNERFSLPNYEGDESYYATQYICEFLKSKGFDGIKYKSALDDKGKNIVLFNTDEKKYEIISSSIYQYRVSNMIISCKRVI